MFFYCLQEIWDSDEEVRRETLLQFLVSVSEMILRGNETFLVSRGIGSRQKRHRPDQIKEK